MRPRPVLLALALAGCGATDPAAPPPSGRPMRVMSLNQCTDQLVLMLLPPRRIASVTWLARDPRFSVEAAAAGRVPTNRGSAEEVARTRPDLVVTDTFSNPGGRALLHRLGYPVLELPDAEDVPAIRRNVRLLAAAVDERERGAALTAALDRDLAAARQGARSERVARWGRDGLGESPLDAAALAAAGAQDVTGPGGDVETLLTIRPALLAVTAHDAREGSLGDDRAGHPLVRRLWPARRRITLSPAATICGTPVLGAAARSLRRQIEAAR